MPVESGQEGTDGSQEGTAASHRTGKQLPSEVFRRLRELARENPRHEIPTEAEELARAVRDGGLAGGDAALASLGIRRRITLQLLDAGAFQPAWLATLEDVAGRDITTIEENGRAFAWLPGFRDPRFGVPDSLYDITDAAVLRAGLEEVWEEKDGCVIGGFVHFARLMTEPDDSVVLHLRGCTTGHVVTVQGERARRPDRVRESGPELTRLAWSGFRARVPAELIPGEPGGWTVTVELRRGELSGRTALVRRTGTAADLSLPFVLGRHGNAFLVAGWTRDRQLLLQAVPPTSVARLLSTRFRPAPPAARRVTRSVRSRLAAAPSTRSGWLRRLAGRPGERH